MLDLIYIVEEQLVPSSAQNDDIGYQPNFTIPSRDGGTAAKLEVPVGAAVAAVAALSVFNPFSLPTALIASAVLGRPSLISLFAKDHSAKSAADPAELEEARLLASYVQQHSISRTQAKAAGYCFQPGHPVVGKAYRKHPLTDYPNPEYGNLYIPSDSYDAILLEERESELLKLLVHLGATKITITKKVSDKTTKAFSGGASVQVGPVAGGGASYSSGSERESDSLDTREFSLSGRTWDAESKVDRDSFFWLSYEPSWKAVVFAREHGGCLSASLEIKESTSFSTDKNLELSVKAKLAEVSAQAGLSNAGAEEKTYFVRAEFAPVRQNA
ncbi:hypothetical protein [Pseudomonas silesiensis]|uniref:hypothetical protein n=1 Tax=Pseudomonas silesiensis TaxID=1853130 RepID=UPI0034D49F33